MKSINGTFYITTNDNTDILDIADKIVTEIQSHESKEIKITSLSINYHTYEEEKNKKST